MEVSKLNIRRLIEEGIAEIDDDVIRALRNRSFPEVSEISSSEAELFFNECLEESEKHIARHASCYTVGRWMWYLRHLPPRVFDSIVGHEEGVRARHLAETLTARHAASDEEATKEFLINGSTVRRIIRFVGMVFHLDNITGHLQWAGTGTAFVFGNRPLADPAPSAEIATNVELYLKRLDAEPLAFAGLGSFVPVRGTKTGEVGMLLAFERSGPVDVKVGDYLFQPRDTRVLAHFDTARISLRDVVDLLGHQSVGDAPLLPGFYVSLAILSLALIAFHASEGVAEHVLEHGYLMLNRESAELLCANMLPRVNEACSILPSDLGRASNLDELAELVRVAGADVRRLRPGPLMVAARDRVLLDVASATQRLFTDAEFPRVAAGKERYRSRAFELAIQKEIDTTPWRPSDELRKLRGRTLRVNGWDLTDIDAIGERDGTLLLVSCKSIPFSGEVDTGNRRIMQNVASRLADAEAEWRGLVEHLRESPCGDNFDFSAWSRVEGIVVTPHAFYVVGDQMHKEVLLGLKVYSSAGELADWLKL